MDKTLEERVDVYIDTVWDQVLADIAELVGCPSVADTSLAEPAAPFGPDGRLIALWVSREGWVTTPPTTRAIWDGAISRGSAPSRLLPSHTLMLCLLALAGRPIPSPWSAARVGCLDAG